MEKPNYRLGKNQRTVEEASILGGLILRSFKRNIEERTFCLFNSCSCDSECECDPECTSNRPPRERECNHCYCVDNGKCRGHKDPCTCDEVVGCPYHTNCPCESTCGCDGHYNKCGREGGI